ncbi:NUDIX hydrolase [Terribacillus halophilus]|uniref:NUDIX hydrolase n=1 Tax=Terribacillus halophilus TaxID=361279 RepID=UPI003982892D
MRGNSNSGNLPIICEGVAAVLLKRIGNEYKVLLLKRATSVLQNVWCYIGGGIEEEEKAWETALREIREETGITKLSLYTSNKFDTIYSPVEDYIYVAPVFVGYVDQYEEVNLNYEHSDYIWLSINDAINFVELPGNDEVLTFIEKHFIQTKPKEWMKVGDFK